MYFCDYHTHTDASPDGHSSAVEMAEKAVSLGMDEIVFTDHYDLGDIPLPDMECFVFDEDKMIKGYDSAVLAAGGRVKVSLGAELGQPHYDPEKADRLLSRHEFDFIICSLHARKELTDYYFVDFNKVDPAGELPVFFEEFGRMLAYKNYDVIGHLPYPMRYIARDRGECDLTPYTGEITQLLKTIISDGKGIEINTSTLRSGQGFTMPPLWIAKLYLELGGEIITVGSDAHRACDLGFGVRQIRRSLYEIGFKRLTVFDKRRPDFVPMI